MQISSAAPCNRLVTLLGLRWRSRATAIAPVVVLVLRSFPCWCSGSGWLRPQAPYENGFAGLLGSGTALDRYRSFLRYRIVSSLAPAPELPFSQRPWGPTLPCPAPLAMVSGSPHPDWV